VAVKRTGTHVLVLLPELLSVTTLVTGAVPVLAPAGAAMTPTRAELARAATKTAATMRWVRLAVTKLHFLAGGMAAPVPEGRLCCPAADSQCWSYVR
jgi:hypothetical protein